MRIPHERRESAFTAKVHSDDLADLQRPCWCAKVVHQHGVSIQSSINNGK